MSPEALSDHSDDRAIADTRADEVSQGDVPARFARAVSVGEHVLWREHTAGIYPKIDVNKTPEEGIELDDGETFPD